MITQGSWSERRSAPLPSRWVAKLWRSACGVVRSVSPSRTRARRTRRPHNDAKRTCPDGSTAPQQVIFRFDGYSLTGQMKVLHGDECGDAPAMVVVWSDAFTQGAAVS